MWKPTVLNHAGLPGLNFPFQKPIVKTADYWRCEKVTLKTLKNKKKGGCSRDKMLLQYAFGHFNCLIFFCSWRVEKLIAKVMVFMGDNDCNGFAFAWSWQSTPLDNSVQNILFSSLFLFFFCKLSKFFYSSITLFLPL